MARGRHLAKDMRQHLPADDAEALAMVRLAAEHPVNLSTGSQVQVSTVSFEPLRPCVGGRLGVTFAQHNPMHQLQALQVDLRVFYRKAKGLARANVLKLQRLTLPPGASMPLVKTLSLRQMTTRQDCPSEHRVEVPVNGDAHGLGASRYCAELPQNSNKITP